MTQRWVIPSLLNLQGAVVNWNNESKRLGIQNPMLDTGAEPAPVQLRWLLSPSIGLPRQPFMVWRNQHPGGSPTKQELANLPGWEPIEVVGLPADDSWADTGYALEEQGPVGQGFAPFDAALNRLQRGAPRLGWAPLSQGITSLPAWESPDLEGYLWNLLEGPLLQETRAMLVERPDPLTHAGYHTGYVEYELEPAHLARWKPRLLGAQPGTAPPINEPARAEWHPLGLLVVGAGTDPLASLALGFGTAVFGQNVANDPKDAAGRDIYMVSVRHQVNLLGAPQEFELADVVLPHGQLRAPDPPAGLSTRLLSRTPPQATDGPAIESVAVRWNRPPNPVYVANPTGAAHPASYAVARFGPEIWRGDILLTPRPVGGWLPYAVGRPDNEDQSAFFSDHLTRAATVDAQVVGEPRGKQHTYAVAAQDIFGRWSPWQITSYDSANEPPQAPSILAVQLDLAGNVTVDFSWDWSDRSPEFMELVGAFEDDPGHYLFTVRLQFGENVEPDTSGFQVDPLDWNLKSAKWGATQDRNAAEPGVRLYRLVTTIPLTFAGLPKRVFMVQARGQCHTHHFIVPGWNISSFGKPSRTEVFDPERPAAPKPKVPEAPQWASLPDVVGISRVVLKWDPAPSATGYVLYEATETTLLAARGLPGPDTTRSFPKRLATLRDDTANLPALRSSFRRLHKELIPSTTHEVTLPRGSSVMHFYAVTAISYNQVESAWPASSKGFIAVAAPRLAVPAAPALEAEPDGAAGQPATKITVGLRPGPAVTQVELYRATGDKPPADADAMGPPVAVLNADGHELTFTDAGVTPGWRRVWYRAVAWSADDNLVGLVGARSASSPAVSVVLPPQDLPNLSDLLVNEPGSTDSECLVSWASSVPVPVTPLGPHTAVLEAHDAGDKLTTRLEGRLDDLPFVQNLADLPTANPADRRIYRVSQSPQRFFVWVPRPAADQPFSVTAKIIDPLGRIASFSADVPPLPALPLPELRPVQIATMAGPIFSLPPRLVAHWQILAPAQPDPPEQYALHAVVRQPGNLAVQPLTIETTLDQVPEVADVQHLPPAQVMALFNRIARIQGTQHYFIFLHIVHPLEVTITLVDPLGRTATQTGTKL